MLGIIQLMDDFSNISLDRQSCLTVEAHTQLILIEMREKERVKQTYAVQLRIFVVLPNVIAMMLLLAHFLL
jgi:hypothetical protein